MYSKCQYKIWNKIISFDMRKKMKNHLIGHKKNEEKGEFDSPKNECLVFQGGYRNHA